MLDVPVISRLNHEKDARYHVNFVRAVEALNKGLADQKIWNVEVDDAKFTLSSAVDRALHTICERHRSTRSPDYGREPWTADFSGYCDFNQAAGRIKRLTKNAPKTPAILDYIEALKEVDVIWKAIQSLKPFIQKGRRPNENKTQEQIEKELRNTGICAICAHRQKLDDDKMVHHGYEMSEYNHSGCRVGECFGTDYPCYELSNEANIAYAPRLLTYQKDLTLALKTYNSGKITELEIEESEWNYKTRKSDVKKITVHKTGPTAEKFARELKYRIGRVESQLRDVTNDIEINQAKIDNWKLKLLAYGR
jgi:hypothetical protein